MSAMKCLYIHLQEQGIDPETATPEQIESALTEMDCI